MATIGNRVHIINTNSDIYQERRRLEELNEDSVYFVLGRANSIWVGDQLYSVGILPENMTDFFDIYHHTASLTGTYPKDVPIDIDLSSFQSDTPLELFSGGVFMDGLRTVDELSVSTRVDEIVDPDSGEVTGYMPIASVIPKSDHLLQDIEIIADFYLFKGKTINISQDDPGEIEDGDANLY